MIPRLLTKWMSKRSNTLVTVLKIIWFLSILTGEYISFWRASSNCSPWPELPSWSSRSIASNKPLSYNGHQQIEGTPAPYNILIIGDPQLTDKFSYGRTGIIQWLTELYSDLYMRRNWNNLNRKLKPDTIIFLGDLMDGGREWTDDSEWSNEVKRYKKLFQPTDNNVKVLYMAGNHDLGFGDGIKADTVKRFKSEFGDTSYELQFDNHSIVVVDSVSMSSSDPNIHQYSRDFVNRLKPSNKPRILFTHVPLYRRPSPISGTIMSQPPEDLCGPLRQKKKQITQGVGYQYQNLMTKELSDFILTHSQADVVFSGDDHDYCEVFHSVGDRVVPEISVNTFSMAQGVQYPGVVLLTLFAGEVPKIESYATKLCLLPDQISIFIRYGILFGVSIIALLAYNLIELYGYSIIGNSSPTIPSYRQEAHKAEAKEHRHLSKNLILVSRCIEALKRTAKDVRQIAIPSILFYVFCVVML